MSLQVEKQKENEDSGDESLSNIVRKESIDTVADLKKL